MEETFPGETMGEERMRTLGGGVLQGETLSPTERIVFESHAALEGLGAWGVGHLYVTNERLIWLQYRWYFFTRTRFSVPLDDIHEWRFAESRSSWSFDEIEVRIPSGVFGLHVGSLTQVLVYDFCRFFPFGRLLRSGTAMELLVALLNDKLPGRRNYLPE